MEGCALNKTCHAAGWARNRRRAAAQLELTMGSAFLAHGRSIVFQRWPQYCRTGQNSLVRTPIE